MKTLTVTTAITVMCMATVPDLGGVPPSTAVRINATSFCFSRSNSLSNTSSPYFLPFSRVTTFKRKCALLSSLYDCTEFIPISASWASSNK
uniref:Secreted protein n=1 Tax=Sinocyclocheilus grahami TaxID=75366 RepID=A0A672SAH3_SINGR